MTKRISTRRGEMKMAALVTASGTARSTIHFYRNAGLLPPPTRRGPRLHVYGGPHLERLRAIARLRASGASIEELQQHFARGNERSPAKDSSGRRRGESASDERPRAPRDASTEALRETMITLAARAFVERGYDAVRVADIARAAGIGKRKFYGVYPSKADLFVDCLDRLRLAVFDPAQRARLDGRLSFEDEGRRRAHAVLERIEPYRMMTNLLAQAAYGTDADLAIRARAAMHRMIVGAEPMFERAIAAGRCRAQNTELLAYMTWGALLALGDRLAMDDRFDLIDVLDAYLDFVHDGTRAT